MQPNLFLGNSVLVQSFLWPTTPHCAQPYIHYRVTCNDSQVLSPRTIPGEPFTCYPLHFGAPSLDAPFGQALLGNDAANVICKDKRGLQDGEGL